MQYKKALTNLSIIAAALAAYVPPEPWSTLTPAGTYPGGMTNYDTLFGIAVQPIAGTMAKRDAVSQIDDGQVQAPKVTEAPKNTETRETLMPAVSQIRDGQIQEPEKEAPKVTEVPVTTERQVPIVSAISQIRDGQIQAPVTEAGVVSQIHDGQVQAPRTEAAVSQIHDGQIQAPHTEGAVSQINDGQIQAPHTEAAVSQIHDGQVQATSPVEKPDTPVSGPVGKAPDAVSCEAAGTLRMRLVDGVLYDSRGRIGSIVANHQFQFDGPPPQAGAIYAKGWSITPTGYLALGDSDLFYQCLSGDFYNLYDQSIGGQCHPVHLEVVNLVNC